MADRLTVINETAKSDQKADRFNNYMEGKKAKRRIRRKRNMMRADADTTAGAMDDNAAERARKRREAMKAALEAA